jgi:hypothetical protein
MENRDWEKIAVETCGGKPALDNAKNKKFGAAIARNMLQ